MESRLTDSLIIRARPTNEQKRAAWSAYQCALRAGALKRQPCNVCGCARADGHHFNYRKPLEVIWVCHKHHGELHASIREYAAYHLFDFFLSVLPDALDRILDDVSSHVEATPIQTAKRLRRKVTKSLLSGFAQLDKMRLIIKCGTRTADHGTTYRIRNSCSLWRLRDHYDFNAPQHRKPAEAAQIIEVKLATTKKAN